MPAKYGGGCEGSIEAAFVHLDIFSYIYTPTISAGENLLIVHGCCTTTTNDIYTASLPHRYLNPRTLNFFLAIAAA